MLPQFFRCKNTYCCRRAACAWGVGLVLAVLVYRRVAQMVTATEEFAGRVERLDLHDIASLVRYAIRTGLISAE